MKLKFYLPIFCSLIFLSSSVAYAQPYDATEPTEVIGRICKTMEEHPPSTEKDNYNLLDYAVCGPGGLRVYPNSSAQKDFGKISLGVLSKKPGKDVVYLHGYMKTRVMSAFGSPGTPSWRPRFRFSWLAVDKVRRSISISSHPRIKRKGDLVEISLDIKNPLNKPILKTDVILTLQGSQYPRPFVKTIPAISPGEKQTVSFDVVSSGKKPRGRIHIKNYGRVYIDIIEKI